VVSTIYFLIVVSLYAVKESRPPFAVSPFSAAGPSQRDVAEQQVLEPLSLTTDWFVSFLDWCLIRFPSSMELSWNLSVFRGGFYCSGYLRVTRIGRGFFGDGFYCSG